MSDDKAKAGKADRIRVNVNENYELRDWRKKFRVTAEELHETVKVVGPTDDFRRYLETL